ncbi:hypothetical protein GCM10012279_50440 [Micromonospora yangpuensis]|nr:hypothetical protein GCM10012279_50440 [Micromonospora yangpuensis]
MDAGRLPASRDEHGHRAIDGVELAGFVRAQGGQPDGRSEESSARNRLRGIVTAVAKDKVMAPPASRHPDRLASTGRGTFSGPPSRSGR